MYNLYVFTYVKLLILSKSFKLWETFGGPTALSHTLPPAVLRPCSRGPRRCIQISLSAHSPTQHAVAGKHLKTRMEGESNLPLPSAWCLSHSSNAVSGSACHSSWPVCFSGSPNDEPPGRSTRGAAVSWRPLTCNTWTADMSWVIDCGDWPLRALWVWTPCRDQSRQWSGHCLGRPAKWRGTATAAGNHGADKEVRHGTQRVPALLYLWMEE